MNEINSSSSEFEYNNKKSKDIISYDIKTKKNKKF